MTNLPTFTLIQRLDQSDFTTTKTRNCRDSGVVFSAEKVSLRHNEFEGTFFEMSSNKNPYFKLHQILFHKANEIEAGEGGGSIAKLYLMFKFRGCISLPGPQRF